MLARSGPLPSGSGWSYELKWDGFRAIVSTEDGLRAGATMESHQRIA
jgi:bifunctional non-homologous end joining protein LigD